MKHADRPIIYEPHPVSAERKAKLRTAGYTILDAAFAPEGYQHPDARRADEVAKPAGKPGACKAR